MTPANDENQTFCLKALRWGVSVLRGGRRAAFCPWQHSLSWTTRSARVARLIALAACCCLWWLSAGCGTNSLIGGGIPEGRSVIRGRVIAADDPKRGVGKVAVTVYSTPTGEPTVAYRVNADDNGLFEVKNIATGKRPDSSPPTISNVVVSVNTFGTSYQSQKVALLLTEKRTASVILAVPPNGFNTAQVGGIRVQAPSGSAPTPVPNVPFTFSAVLLDTNGNPLVSQATGQAYVPSLVLDGLDVQSVDGNGLFEAYGTMVGINSIAGSVSLPGQSPPITSSPINVVVQVPATVVTESTPQIVPGVPAPPTPPGKTARSAAQR